MKHKHTNPVAVISSFRHINWELMEFLIVSCNIHILISYTTMYLARHFHWTLRIECMIKDWPIIWNYSLQSYVFLWNMTLVLYCISSTVRNCTNIIYTEYFDLVTFFTFQREEIFAIVQRNYPSFEILFPPLRHFSVKLI